MSENETVAPLLLTEPQAVVVGQGLRMLFNHNEGTGNGHTDRPSILAVESMLADVDGRPRARFITMLAKLSFGMTDQTSTTLADLMVLVVSAVESGNPDLAAFMKIIERLRKDRGKLTPVTAVPLPSGLYVVEDQRGRSGSYSSNVTLWREPGPAVAVLLAHYRGHQPSANLSAEQSVQNPLSPEHRIRAEAWELSLLEERLMENGRLSAIDLMDLGLGDIDLDEDESGVGGRCTVLHKLVR